MPYFIITYGPAGSGKSALQRQYLKDIMKLKKCSTEKCLKKNNIIHVSVDNIIEGDPKYQKQLIKIIKNKKLDEKEKDKQISKLYEKYKPKAKKIKDKNLKKAIKEGKHIIYETKGIKAGTIKKIAKEIKNLPKNYRKVLVFPYVDSNNLIQKKIGKKRKIEEINENIMKSYNNLPHIANKVDSALIYDNNKKPKLILTKASTVLEELYMCENHALGKMLKNNGFSYQDEISKYICSNCYLCLKPEKSNNDSTNKEMTSSNKKGGLGFISNLSQKLIQGGFDHMDIEHDRLVMNISGGKKPMIVKIGNEAKQATMNKIIEWNIVQETDFSNGINDKDDFYKLSREIQNILCIPAKVSFDNNITHRPPGSDYKEKESRSILVGVLKKIYELPSKIMILKLISEYNLKEPISEASRVLFWTIKEQYEDLVKVFIKKRNNYINTVLKKTPMSIKPAKNNIQDMIRFWARLDRQLDLWMSSHILFNVSDPYSSEHMKHKIKMSSKDPTARKDVIQKVGEENRIQWTLVSGKQKKEEINKLKQFDKNIIKKNHQLKKLEKDMEKFNYKGFCPRVPLYRLQLLLEFPVSQLLKGIEVFDKDYKPKYNYKKMYEKIMKNIIKLEEIKKYSKPKITNIRNSFKRENPPNLKSCLDLKSSFVKIQQWQIDAEELIWYMNRILEKQKKLIPELEKWEKYYAKIAKNLTELNNSIVS